MLQILRLALCFFYMGFSILCALENNFFEQTAENPVSIELISENQTIKAGHSFWVGLRFDIDKNWHAYWKNPGVAGMPPIINWSLPQGFEIEEVLWPTPKQFILGSAVSFGYENEWMLLVLIASPPNYRENSIEIKADVQWIACSDTTCLPGDSQVALTVGVNNDKINSAATQIFSQARARIPQNNAIAEAIRKESLVELNVHIPSFPDNQIVLKAEFFPEKHNSVSHSEKMLIQQNSNDSKLYTIILQENEAFPILKGVLVLHSPDHFQSYEINAPIASNNENEIVETAKLDASKISPNQSDVFMKNWAAVTAILSAKLNAVDSATAVYDPLFNGSPYVRTAMQRHELESKGIIVAVLLAFIGGLILNLMPCVLPVISLKILSFVKLAGESRALVFKHGLAFTFGVILSFWTLAIAILLLQIYGRSAGWGFQLQEPLFVALLAAFLFVFGLSLFGVFEIGTSFIAAGGQAQQMMSKGYALMSSFVSGVVATLVATPCTGPFLGSVVGFAFTLGPMQTLLIFTSIAFGMSAPYLVLAAFPGLLRFVPKPGAWMIAFKELMGFFMMATVLWLVWVFGALTSVLAINLLSFAFFLLAVGAWVVGRWGSPISKVFVRSLGWLIALSCFGIGTYIIVLASTSWHEVLEPVVKSEASLESPELSRWERFSPERVAELQQKGVPVFIDFTAKWCLICQANHLVLTCDEVTQKFIELGVVKMKADWTRNDQIIATELRKFGRNSVPLYVLYDSMFDVPHILPQVLTPEIILEELKQLEK